MTAGVSPAASVEPVEAGTGPVPLVVVDRGEGLAAELALKPQFGRATPVLRGPAPTLTLVADRPVVVDVGDGSAPAEVAPGETISPSPGRLTISRDGRTADVRVELDPRPVPVPDEVWSLPGGTAWVLRGFGPPPATSSPASPPPAPRHTELRCPLVCVEGFPGGHGFVYSHDVLAQQGVLDALLARGFDLVAVGLDDGMRPMEENAAVVEACLAEVASRTPLPVTLLGWSMGGLLCRLAVSAIEARGEQHAVTTLVTWDTPHRGSVTQLGVQWLVSSFAGSHPTFAPYAAEIDSPSNREMVMLSLQPDGSAGVDPLRTAFLEKLAWPREPRRVLLSCGRGGGGRDGVRPGEVLVHWHASEGGDIHLRAMGGTHPVGEGRWDGEAPAALSVADDVGWDGMPGARGSYPAQAAELLQTLGGGAVHPVGIPDTCQVPTVSALDLDQAPDAPVPDQEGLIVCETDQPHLVVDAAAAAAVLRQVGSPFDPSRFDPHDPDFLRDPYPTYALFRRFAPRFAVRGGALWCFRAEDCDAVLRDKDVWRKAPPVKPPPGPGPTAALADMPPGLFSSDPPLHDGLRQAVERAFRAALEQAPAVASQRAQGILASWQGTEVIELVQDFALPLPAQILFDLLGLPDDPVLRPVLINWQQSIATAHDVTQSGAVRIQGATCSMALRTYFTGLVYSHDVSPVPGLVGGMCDAFKAAGVDRNALIATLSDIVVAGYLSTTYLISNGMNRLLSGDPGMLDRLRADPGLVPAAVEELLRIEGPVQLIDRVAATDTFLGGDAVPAGTHVALVVASANHDPDWFEAPEEFRLDRDHAHLAFGDGIHTCVGAPLARIVTPIALRALLDHASSIELDGEPQWQTDPYLRGATSLPLRITPAVVSAGAST